GSSSLATLRERSTQRIIIPDTRDGAGDVVDLGRFEIKCVAAGDFGQTCGARAGDRATGVHRFYQRNAETFEERRKDQAARVLVEPRQFGAAASAEMANEIADAGVGDQRSPRLVAFKKASGHDAFHVLAVRAELL